MNIKSGVVKHKQNFIPFPAIDVESSIPVRFEAQAEKYPKNIAVKESNTVLTYNEMNKRANQLARSIMTLDDQTDRPIIVLTGYGIPAIVAILGILKAGRAYVVVDPGNPKDRIIEIFNDSLSSLILTDNKNHDLSSDVAHSADKTNCPIINIDQMDPTLSTSNLGLSIPPDTYAHLFYTSGTTGMPKGVINNHRNVLHKIRSHTNLYEITPEDKIVNLTSPSFSASTSNIFGALLNGAALYPFQMNYHSFTELSELMIREGITMYQSMTTTFRQFAKSLTGDQNFKHLRLIRLGGETTYKSDIDLYKKHFPDECVLRIAFAGTEAGFISYNVITKDTEITSDIVPVGTVTKSTEVLLLDEDHQPVQPGEAGEIAVRSRYLPVGYWQRPDLNNSRYLPDPDGGDKRIFLTGDLGKFLPDGTLEHIARKDTMVKIRGLRIETTEIEAHLLALDSIKEAVVIAQEDRFKEKRLVAYVVPSSEIEPPIIQMREAIAEKLPDYMIPTSFIFIDEIPLMPSSGKVNLKELPTPSSDRLVSGQKYIAPRNDTESKLAQIFEKHLKVKPVGVRDDFFELGGHSLTAIQIVTEIEEKLQKSISIPEFVKALTVEKISTKISTPEPSSSFRFLVEIQTKGTKPPLFGVPPSARTSISIEAMVEYIGEDQPLYGFEYAGMDSKTEPFTTFNSMAQAYIQELRLVQPNGPYYLCGMCMGGMIAFEMAQQLIAKGQKVAFLGILDSNFYPTKRKSVLFYYFTTRQFIAKLRGKELNVVVPPLDFDLDRFSGDDILRERFRHVYITNILARLEYTSPPYSGLITQFTTDARHSRHAIKGWAEASTQEVDVHIIPGNYGRRRTEQVGIMKEPNIQVTVQKLRDALEKARRNAESS